MRRVPTIGVLTLVVVLGATPVSAKEGVRAKLEAPVSLNAPPDKTIRVAWRLVDEEGRPFGAGGIYLRVSRCGTTPLRIPATARGDGRYHARMKVPKRGIRKLVVGLEGWRIIGDRRERADVFFEFDPRLARRC